MKLIFKSLFRTIPPNRYIAWAFTAVLLTALEAYAIVVILDFIQTCTTYATQSKNVNLNDIYFGIAFVLLLIATRSITQFVMGILQTRIYLDQVKFIKNKITASIYDISTASNKLSTGEQLFYSNEGPEISSQFLNGLLAALSHLAVTLSLFYLLWKESGAISFFMITGTIVVYLIINRLTKNIYSLSAQVASDESRYNQAVYEDLVARTDVLGLGAESFRKKIREELVKCFSSSILTRDKYRYFILALTELLGTCLLIGAISYFTFTSTGTTEFATQIVGIMIIIQRLNARSGGLISAFAQMKEGWPMLKRLSSILSLDVSAPAQNKIYNNRLPIIVKNLVFNYADSDFSLGPISFAICPGEWVGLSGENGSGKSTFGKVLAGLLPSTEINGARASYVSSEPFLFSTTLESNILLGAHKNNTLLKKVLQTCQVDKLYEDTRTKSSKGASYSSGQKQRISIARALYQNQDFIIFDECFSSIDPMSAKSILQEMHVQFPNLSLLLITHNTDLLTYMDRTYTMSKLHAETARGHGVHITQVGMKCEIPS